MPDRRQPRLLTLDRALLLVAITVGGWVATKDLSQAALEKRVSAQELTTLALQSDQTQLKIDRAVLAARLEAMTTEVGRLREVIERKLP